MEQMFTAVRVLVLLAAPAALMAQAPVVPEAYKEMLMGAVKSGKFGLSPDWDARVRRISGDVRVRSSDGGEWSVLEGGMPLYSADSIKTADGTAEIFLDDKGVISVGRNTELEAMALSKTDSVLNLKFGNIAAKIKSAPEEKLKLKVQSPSAICEVRGTEFAVEYSQLVKTTGAAVFDEGRVAVDILGAGGKSQGEYLLEKNTELTFGPDQKRFKPVQLSGMNRYKTQIIRMRRTLTILAKTWKPADDARKEALRDRVFKPGAGPRGKTVAQPAPVKKSSRGARVKVKSAKKNSVRGSRQVVKIP
jgi:hypothetical protein